jgi:hypothetical protein
MNTPNNRWKKLYLLLIVWLLILIGLLYSFTQYFKV